MRRVFGLRGDTGKLKEPWGENFTSPGGRPADHPGLNELGGTYLGEKQCRSIISLRS
jgi:hypothetical protein